MKTWLIENYGTGEAIGEMDAAAAVDVAEFHARQYPNTVLRVRRDEPGSRWWYFVCYERSGDRLGSQREANRAIAYMRSKK